MDRIIEVEGFSLSIDGREVLNDISFTVREGEYLSIVGPNGAGKTSLLKSLTRIYTGGYGDIRIAGKALNRYTQRELARLLCYVPQADGRMLPFTVREFVTMGRYPYLSPFSTLTRKDEMAVFDAIAMTGMLEFADRDISTLSGGERQKVFIAAALAQGGKVILLDEPATFLDPKHEAEVKKLLRYINCKRGITIVSVTHDINSAVLMGRCILALKGGKVAFYGGTDEFMNNKLLEEIYEKSFLFVRHPQTGKSIVVPEVS